MLHFPYERELPIGQGIHENRITQIVNEYWIVCNFIHRISGRIFCRLASGFVHFKSCLSSSTHTLLMRVQKEVISICHLTLYLSVMMLGEPSQWVTGFYIRCPPGRLLITIHNVVCEPYKYSPLYSNKIYPQLIFPLSASQKCPWPPRFTQQEESLELEEIELTYCN